MKKLLLLLTLSLIISVPLSACGVKPKKLEAPEGSENVTFPNTYPTAAK